MLAGDIDGTEHLITAAIRGEQIEWSASASPEQASQFIAALRFHGVAPLFDRALRMSSAGSSWPAAIRDHCRGEVRQQAVLELTRRAGASRVIQGLHDAGIEALVLKGGALAYSHYESPILRPRADLDLLIASHHKASAKVVLAQLQYQRRHGVSGDLISHQENWGCSDGRGLVDEIDLHWRAHNSFVLGSLFDFREFRERAVALPELGPYASALAPVDALLFAVVHLAGHGNAPYYLDGVPHDARRRLIWLYDLHLLLTRMTSEELGAFVEEASRRRVKAISRDALTRCSECFRTPVPSSFMEALRPAGPEEPSARYCRAGQFAQLRDEFIALKSNRIRLRWLAQMALPSEDYIREKYGEARAPWLPVLYARRIVGGAWKLAKSTVGLR